MEDITIKDYLQGKFEYEFTDLAFKSVLIELSFLEGVFDGDDNEITITSSIKKLTAKGRDLAKAELYLILAGAISGGSETTTRGEFSYTTRNLSFGVNDRIAFTNKAEILQSKWIKGSKKKKFIVSKSR